MFKMLLLGVRSYLLRPSSIGPSTPPPVTPPRVPPPLTRQPHIEATQMHTGENAVRVQNASTELRTIDRADHITTAQVLITPSERTLMNSVRDRITAGGVPTADEVKQLKKLAVKLEAHLSGEIQNVTTERRFLFFTGNRNFQSLTLNRQNLVDERTRLNNDLTQARATLANNPDLARRNGITAETVARLTDQLDHCDKKLKAVRERIEAKLADVGRVGRYTASAEGRAAIHEAMQNNPALALKVAADPRTPGGLLEEAATRFGTGVQRNEAVIEAVLKNPNSPAAALRTIIQDPENSTQANRELVSAHRNASADVLTDLATRELHSIGEMVAGRAAFGSSGYQVLENIARNEHTSPTTLATIANTMNTNPLIDDRATQVALASNRHTPPAALTQLASINKAEVMEALSHHEQLPLEGMERILRNPTVRTNNAVIDRVLERVPDLSKLHADTLAAIPPERLQAEVTRCTTEASARVDSSVTGRFQSVSSMNSARLNCQALVTEFEALAARLPDGPVKTAIGVQVTELKAKAALVQEPLSRMERRSDMTNALNDIRHQREIMDVQLNKFRSVEEALDSSGLGSGTLVGTGSDSSLQTFARLQRVNGQVERAMDNTLTQITSLRSRCNPPPLPPAENPLRAPESVRNLLQAQHGALNGLTGDNVTSRLATLQSRQAELLTAINNDPTLTRSEKALLATLARNLEKNLTSYETVKKAIDGQEERIANSIGSLVEGGMTESSAAIQLQCSETANRLGLEFRNQLSSPLAIDPEFVRGVRTEARTLVHTELMPTLTRMEQEYRDAGNVDMANFIKNQAYKLKHMDTAASPGVLRDAQGNDERLLAAMTPEQRAVVGQIREEVDRTCAVYADLSTAVDNKVADLNRRHSSVTEKTAFIRAVLEAGGGGSGFIENKSLTVSIAIAAAPFLRLEAGGRVGMAVIRNPETGQIEVTTTKQANLGVSTNPEVTGVKAGLGLNAGVQTKWAFNTPEEAARFLQFTETGLPVNYRPPSPTEGLFGGVQATVQAQVPGLRVEGNINGQRLSERMPNGDSQVQWQAQMMGRLQFRLPGGPDTHPEMVHGMEVERESHSATVSTSSVMLGDTPLMGGHEVEVEGHTMGVEDTHRPVDPGRMGGIGLSVSLEARVTYQNRTYFEQGVRAPDRDKTTCEVELKLTAGMDASQLQAIARHVISGMTTARTAYRTVDGLASRATNDVGTGDEERAITYMLARMASAVGGGRMEMGGVLRLEFENGHPIGLHVGVTGRTESEVSVSVFGTGVKYEATREANVMSTRWMPKDQHGLERMEAYFMADEALATRTMGSARWADTDNITDGHGVTKTVAQWKAEWKEKKETQKLIGELRTCFMAPAPGGGPNSHEYARLLGTEGRARMLLGQSVSQLEAQWGHEQGEEGTLRELRNAFMADRTTGRGTYRAELETRGNDASWFRGNRNELGARLFADSSAIICGRPLHRWERDWAQEQTLEARGRNRADLLDNMT